ncbi:MAG: U32 family peptidase [Clostridia bacterium]|nr:U32 family peptidase [Clostridia bacterium]
MEILAPAGSRESLEAAVQNGADAVYLGGSRLNARAFASGVGDLAEAVRYAHLRGTDVHFTLNTVLLDKEVEAFQDQAREAALAGVDAFIVADLGALLMLQHLWPSVPLHASTQLSIRSTQSAEAYSSLGFTRLVLAREVPADEVREIHRAASAELEVFCHGALCVCASGRCLMSSLLGGRSANRGTCAQPCRLEYTLAGHNGYFLNTKDLALANEIEVLRDCGVSSLKIEGRMKGPLYVAAAVQAYKEADDTGRVSDAAMEALLLTFSRGGFTTGAFGSDRSRFHREMPGHTGIPLGRIVRLSGNRIVVDTSESLQPGDTVAAAGADRRPATVTAVRRVAGGLEITLEGSRDLKPGEPLLKKADAEILRRLEESCRDGHRLTELRGVFRAEPDQPLQLTVQLPDGRQAAAAGAVPEPARTRELTGESVRQQLSRTGGTPFRFASLAAELAPGLAVPKSALNNLRRQALEKAESLLQDRYPNREEGALPVLLGSRRKRRPERIAAACATAEQAEAVAETADELYLPAAVIQTGRFSGARCLLPGMASSREVQKILALGAPLVAGCLLPDMEGTVSDASFNVTNSYALKLLCDLGSVRVTLSEELNAAQIRDLMVPDGAETEVIGYGYQTLMVTENCPIECDRKHCRLKGNTETLGDRRGRSFPLTADGTDSCRVRILNALPLYAADIIGEISCDVIRLVFTSETPAECRRIAQIYKDALALGNAPGFEGEYTRGHLRRGL